MTDWNEYRNPDFRRMREALARPAVVDARNLYDPDRMLALGFHYQSIGRAGAGRPAPPARAAVAALA
jgi:UDPglucose 6-dehydrogenase